MFYLWWRMNAANRNRVWPMYGLFCGLIAFGSCIGIATWTSKMQQLVENLLASDDNSKKKFQDSNVHFAKAANWQAAFVVTYAIEFLCLSAAKLMVLDRMSAFAMPSDTESGDHMKHWRLWGKIVMAAVITGNLIGLAGNIAAAPYWGLSASYSLSASFGNNQSAAFGAAAKVKNDEAFSVEAVQYFCEVAVLLLIICAFAVVGFLCVRRLSTLLRSVNSVSGASSQGNYLRKQILITTGFIFIAFLLRSVHSIMQALASRLSNSFQSCSGNTLGLCNPVCYNMWTHMLRWLQRTPEFQLSVLLISSPIALLVALWGMTSSSTLKAMSVRQDVECGSSSIGLREVQK